MITEFPHGRIILGNAADCLRDIEPAQVIISSPPYWALRSYPGIEPQAWNSGWHGQMGQQPDPQMFAEDLADVFASIPLREDGLLFINIMDSFVAGKGKSGTASSELGAKRKAGGKTIQRAASNTGGKGITAAGNDLRAMRHLHLKSKDMAGVPWRLAFAMQARGFYWRDNIIWAKKNGMPESGKSRLMKRHESILMFSRSPNYFFDPFALGEKPAPVSIARANRARGSNQKYVRQANSVGGAQGIHRNRAKGKADFKEMSVKKSINVWHLATASHKSDVGDHVAVMPLQIPLRLVKLASRPGDLIIDPFCGTGTVCIAAAGLGRRFVGADLDARAPKFLEDWYKKQNVGGLII